jgi:hypothetical protein
MRRTLLTSSICGLFASAALLQAADDATVTQIRVQPDKAPDCSSLKAIAESVTRGCTSNDAKAIAIYNFMELTHYHRDYPSEPGGIPVIKEITNYGWSLCGGLHCEESALWRQLGWGWRFVGWSNPGHTTVEAEYDGRWHYLDVFLKFYAWMPDGKGGRTIAGEADIANDSNGLITEAFTYDKGRSAVYAVNNQFMMVNGSANWSAPAFLTCGDGLDGVISGVNSRNIAGSPDTWAGINHADGDYTTDVNLAPGYALTNTWDPIADAWYWAGQNSPPSHTCPGHKDTRNDPGFGMVLEPYIKDKPARSYGNGMLTFAPDFSTKAVLQSFLASDNVTWTDKALAPDDPFKPASVEFQLATPYIITKATGSATGASKVEVSIDAGNSWTELNANDFTSTVKGKLSALVKVTFKEPLKALKFETVVQNNPGALPYLSPGRNVVAVSVGDAKKLGDNALVVTYAYRLGSSTKTFDGLCEQGKEIARQHNATWSDTVVYDRKTFMAKDLPAKFDIDCPTPTGQRPVYPRMLFMTREVVAPGASPTALPAGAVEAKAAAPDELATLPNPFLVGTDMPPVVKPRAIRTIEIPLQYVQFDDVKGTVAQTGSLVWPKNPSEEDKVLASVVLINGDLKDLPAKDIAAARLCVPVLHGHNSAPCQLGTVFLNAAVAPGTAVDVKSLPESQGMGVIPKQPADVAEYQPAKVFPIDVTAPIRAIAAKAQTFHGVALRVVPNRSVDDGYTVRCEISPTDKVVLQVDVYNDAQ